MNRSWQLPGRAMRVEVSDDELVPICKQIEGRLGGISCLGKLSVNIELLDNFDDLPEASRSEVYRKTPAVHRRSTGEILVNRATFPLDPSSSIAALAILAHEIAHAYLHQGGSVPEELRAGSK